MNEWTNVQVFTRFLLSSQLAIVTNTAACLNIGILGPWCSWCCDIAIYAVDTRTLGGVQKYRSEL